MEFLNKTPFQAVSFPHRNVQGETRTVVVAAVSYRIEEDGTLTNSDPLSTINFAELAFGDPAQTSLRRESDLAPEKPVADLILVANAYSQKDAPAPKFPVAITVRMPNDPTTGARGKILRQLTLVVTGPRKWRLKNAMTRMVGRVASWATLGLAQQNNWKVTQPEPVVEVPLRHEYAYGGTLYIQDVTGSAKRKFCFAYNKNPVGRGYLPTIQDFKVNYGVNARAARAYLRRWAETHTQFDAPQIEGILPLPSHPDMETGVLAWGAISKHWMPRIGLAGTYDAKWESGRHPLLPEDFNPLYWSGAHPDLRFDHLPSDAVIDMKNLVRCTRRPDQTLTIRLQGVSIKAEYDDIFQETAQTSELFMDTVHIDLLENRLTLLYRINLPEVYAPGYLAIFTEDVA